MNYLVQRGDENFATFKVGTGKKNVLVESAAGKVLRITKLELVQATADTIEHWHPIRHVWHQNFIASLRAVDVGDEMTAADKLEATIEIWLREHALPFGLKSGCEIEYCAGQITVIMPLLLFWTAAEDHLKTDPRLPTRDLHPAIARKLKMRWANMIERLAGTDERKRA